MTVLDPRPSEAAPSGAAAAGHVCAPPGPGDAPTAAAPGAPAEPQPWPPTGSEPVDIPDLYERLAARGMDYGPSFRLLSTAWRRGTEVFAEVPLDDSGLPATGMLMHPALLDAALHAASIPFLDRDGEDTYLPFAWRGVRVHRPGATALRIRIALTEGDSLSLTATDMDDRPVLCARSLMVRPVSREQLRGTGASGALLRPVWRPLAEVPARPAADEPWAFLGTDHLGVTGELKATGRSFENYSSLHTMDAALRRGAPVPSVVLVSCADGTDGVDAVRAEAQRCLALVQEWLTDDRLAGSRLVFITQGAQSCGPDEDIAGLAASVVWGLVRSSQAEQPGRFGLVDIDEADGSRRALLSAVSALTDPDTPYPQLAVRHGSLLQLRLQRSRPGDTGAPARRPTRTHGTVVMTGGTGALGTVLARHLAQRHGVGRLLLLNRSGPDAPAARRLVAELTELGAHTDVVACDVADADALDRVLNEVPAEHPVTMVIHAAGVTDDGAVGTMTPRRLDRVMRPKVDASLALHRVSRSLPDCELILFSSVSGIVGGAGQANYAAANTFVDALAQHRRAAGLHAVSLAWGLWDEAGMGERLNAADLKRMERAGISALRVSDGLALFDAALARDDAVLVPIQLYEPALRDHSPQIPDVLRDLCPPRQEDRTRPTRRPDHVDPAELRRSVAELPEAERTGAVVQLIRTEVAGVLALPGPEAVQAGAEFSAIGFDSLTTVDLNRRLAALTGLRLPATLLFDYRTPADLAAHLLRLTSQD
ncbi:type I polyketide synthase [Streptomyces sp. NBC_01794]|uniref:type I polyketide synthase n=1 Tax=Streptomyces sp. NBC_01794 TaxID=2975942 RepID=UPI003092DF1B|nr:type I polyketide synthase [Streptomyces sp. NBC_01794]